MLGVMAVVCIAMIGVIGLILMRDLFTRKGDVLCWRNLFLVGYIHFVCLSGFFVAYADVGALRRGAITDSSVTLYTVSIVAFLAIFLGACAWARSKPWMARVFPKVELPVTSPSLLIAIGLLLLIAGTIVILVPTGIVGIILAQLRTGMPSAAVALATYFLLAQRFNPLSWVVFFFALGFGFIISVTGGIGRRDALAVLIAVPWAWYFAALRYHSAGSILVKVGALAAAGAFMIALFTTVRFEGVDRTKGLGAVQYVTAAERAQQLTEVLTNPSVSFKVIESLLYTDTAGNSMYIMENYPENHDYIPGWTPYWIIVNPIPRVFWPDKPEALGLILSRQMNVDANLGPGIVGQSYAEGGLIAVVIYAVFFGLIYGAADRGLRDRASNPFFVAMMVGGGGNILAMPRGDVALFLLIIITSVVGTWIVFGMTRVLTYGWAGAFPVITPSAKTMAQAEPSEEDVAYGLADHEGAEAGHEASGTHDDAARQTG